MKRSIEKLRLEYGNTPFLEEDLHDDPVEQFSHWFQEAVAAQVVEPNGMTLSTVTPFGHPSARTILLKGIEKGQFLFYTSYESRKGEQLIDHPMAALTFWWREIYRQVTVEGSVKKLSRKASIAYFHKRPRGAQLAALASHQSDPLATRKELETTFHRLKKRYAGKAIPCPTRWGGYALLPERMEFWQGRKNRLHDRFLYVRTNGEWVTTRLAP